MVAQRSDDGGSHAVRCSSPHPGGSLRGLKPRATLIAGANSRIRLQATLTRKSQILVLAPCLMAVAAFFAGCVEAPSFPVREKIRLSWEHPQAYAGPDDVVIKLSRAKDDKLYFPLKVNGRDIEVVIDTGSRSVLDLKTMHALGVTTYPTRDKYYGFGGYLRAHVGFVDEIDLGGLKLVGKSVTVIDLSDLMHSQTERSLPPIDGLVGADLLAPLSAKIDYEALTLTLKKPASPRR